MANVSEIITLGIGVPSSIPYFLTFGLGLGAPVEPPVEEEDTGDVGASGTGSGIAGFVYVPPRRVVTTVWRLRPEPSIQVSEASGDLHWVEPFDVTVSDGTTAALGRARWVVKIQGASAWQYHKTSAEMAIRYDAESYWRSKSMRQADELEIAELMLLGVL